MSWVKLARTWFRHGWHHFNSSTQLVRGSVGSARRIRPPHLRAVELLEQRTLLSTLEIDGAGILTYSAVPGIANNVTVSVQGGTYTIDDPGEAGILLGPGAFSVGCQGNGLQMVTCPDSSINQMTMNLDDAGDSVNVRSLNDPTTINGGEGDDSLSVDDNGNAAGGSADGVASPLTINGGNGSNSLVMEDTSDPAANGVTVTATTVGAGGSSCTDNFFGTGGTLTYSQLSFLTLFLSDLGNTACVANTSAGTTTIIFGGAAGDGLNVFGTGSGGVTINGRAGDDTYLVAFGSLTGTVSIQDSSAVGDNDVATIRGTAGDDNAGNRIQFNGVSSIVRGAETITRLAASFGVESLTIDALGGNDDVDFSTYNEPVSLLGNSGDDTLTGSPQADLLQGDAGMDQLFGGAGTDSLVGGANNDALSGQAGSDRFIFASAWGTDTVTEPAEVSNDTMDFTAVTANLTFTLGSVTVTDGVNTATHAANEIEQLLGGSGNDQLVVNFSAGIPIPANGLGFDGGGQPLGGGDSISLDQGAFAGTFNAVQYLFVDANSGEIRIDPDGFNMGTPTSVIAYAGLEPIADNLDVVNRSFVFLGGSETISIMDDGVVGNGRSAIDSTLGEIVTFDNPTTSLSVDGAGGAAGSDTVDLFGVDSTFGAVLNIFASPNGDTIRLRATPAGTTTFVTGGALNDTIVVSSDPTLAAGTLDNVQGLVVIDGLAGANSLSVSDVSDPDVDAAAIVTANSITGLAPSAINYSATGGTFSEIQITAGTGGDTINVRSTLAGASTVVNGGGGADVINVSSDSPVNSGTLDNLAGLLTINGGAGANTLNVSDSGDADADPAVVVTSTAITGIAPVTVNYFPSTGAGGTLNVFTSAGADVINVQSTLAGATTVVNGGGAGDTINVSSNAPANTGTLDNIAGTLMLDGGAGVNVLVVSDSGDPDADTAVVLTNTTLTGLAPATIQFLGGSGFTGGITVQAGTAGDTIELQGSLMGSPTTINAGPGADTFRVTGNSSASLNGGAGDDTFRFTGTAVLTGNIDGGTSATLDFSGYASSRVITLTGLGTNEGFAGTDPSITGGFNNITSLVGSAAADSLNGLNAVSGWTINGTNQYVSTNTLDFSAIENLNGGSAVDTFDVSANHTGNLHGGGDADTFNFFGGAILTGAVNGGSSARLDFTNAAAVRTIALTGLGTIDGFAGTDASITGGFDNITALTGTGGIDSFTGLGATATWDIDGTNEYTSTNTLDLDTIENLTGGAGTDIFNIAGAPAANLAGGAGDDLFLLANAATLAGSIDGQGGTDTLSYAAFTIAVVVNLTTGTGTNLIGAAVVDLLGLETVIGGNVGDNLTGGAADESLVGGPGIDLLFGGPGNDTLAGNAGNDMLDGGTGNNTADYSTSLTAIDVNLQKGKTTGDGLDGLIGIANVFGSPLADRIFGSTLSNILWGNDGDDTMRGGGGDDFLVGGAGADSLSDKGGRNVLIGGTGSDTLSGAKGDDILIAGSTDLDANETAQRAILAEWTSFLPSHSYQARVANLRDGTGSGDRLNGGFFLSAATVHDDATADLLTGGKGRDWFIARTLVPVLDTILARDAINEIADAI